MIIRRFFNRRGAKNRGEIFKSRGNDFRSGAYVFQFSPHPTEKSCDFHFEGKAQYYHYYHYYSYYPYYSYYYYYYYCPLYPYLGKLPAVPRHGTSSADGAASTLLLMLQGKGNPRRVLQRYAPSYV
jgi:hypothetical protein